jgi:lariat debranching enzyme
MSRPDIFLSHDWPAGIEHQGNLNHLLKRKTFLKADIDKVRLTQQVTGSDTDSISQGQLGSPPLRGLLQTLKPAWWFSAHLHVRYEARVVHVAGPPPNETVEKSTVPSGLNPDEIAIDDDEDTELAEPPVEEDKMVITDAPNANPVPDGTNNAPRPKVNPDEIVLDDEDLEVEPPAVPPPPAAVVHTVPSGGTSGQETRFLSLDKCLPRREFLEVSLIDNFGHVQKCK